VSSPASHRRLRGAKLRLALLPLAYVLDLPDACANDRDHSDVEFDAGMLRLRGIDPKLADFFREAPRFTAGTHAVSLFVNGRPMGRTNARFDEHGALCVDRALLRAAEVTEPRDVATDDGDRGAPCIDMASLFAQATTDLDPAKGEVSLLVPTDALKAPDQDTSGYTTGGVAALFNYEIIALDSRWDSRRSRYTSANTELGFNAGDWVVRSRQASTVSDGRQRTDVLDSYAQRTFAGQRAVLQLGDINVMNPALPGAQIAGVQVMSEQALASQGSGATVGGVAQSQARVEVRQDGVLVYSTVVPAGPFELKDVPRINRRADLDVTVSGAGGESQRFVVPAAMAGAVAAPAGYSLALGRMRNAGGIGSPWLISGGWSGGAGSRLNVSGGATMASNYGALGAGLGAVVAPGSQLQFDVSGSHASRDGATGMQAVLAASQRLGEQWSFALSHTRQSRGFRDLLDASWSSGANAQRARYRDQTSVSLSWSTPALGNVSAGMSHSRLFDGRMTERVLASWGASVGLASVSLSSEWNLSHTRRAGNNSVYLNVSLPLGENRRLGHTVRRYAGETRYGASFSEQVNEFASYRAGLEYRTGDHRRSMTTAVSLLPRYAQLDAGYSRDTRSSNTSLGARGGVVWHARGVTASPYPVRDTFGVLTVGDAAGIRISTPGGPVWTDARGYAVVSQLAPYGKSSIEVATDSLPRNVDIHNGASVISAGRGAVTTMDFGVSRTRRVLLRVRTGDGLALPFGSSVTDEAGDVVGVVERDGEIFVPNALATPRLRVSGPDTMPCEVIIENGEPADPGAYYESASAVCRPVGEQPR